MKELLSFDTIKLSLEIHQVVNDILENVAKFSLLYVKSSVVLKVDLCKIEELVKIVVLFSQTSLYC